MKKNGYIFLIAGSVLASCAGESSDISSSSDTASAQTDSVVAGSAFLEFTAYVESLERKVENVDSALAKFEAVKIDFSQEEKDSSFFIMKDFMMSFDITEDEIGDLTEERQNEIEKQYGKYGFTIWYAEGFPYAMPDIKFLEKQFKKDMSAELSDYIHVLKKTFQQTTSDAGLSIEWTELADRIIVCEDYLVENQESKYAPYVLSSYQENMNFLMWGLDNTPVTNVYDSEAIPALDEMVSEVYQKLIKDDKHKTGKIIADHLAWLESKKFRFTYEEVSYLTEDEAKMYLGIQ